MALDVRFVDRDHNHDAVKHTELHGGITGSGRQLGRGTSRLVPHMTTLVSYHRYGCVKDEWYRLCTARSSLLALG